MKWEKLGLVYCAANDSSWAYSHAHVPTPLLRTDNTIRVFVAFLDSAQIGRIGYVDVDAADPTRVLRVSAQPVLDIGADGMFDDNGVIPMCVVSFEDKLYLFYTGWQLGHKVRYCLLTGLALSQDQGETFSRVSPVPVLERAEGETFVRSTPSIIRCGSQWKMWYIAGDKWIDDGGTKKPSYGLRYQESSSLTVWKNRGRPVFDPGTDDEFGLSRPCVYMEKTQYRMIYSVRSRSAGYRLGYAESEDGLHWLRKDEEIGIDVSKSGWDSEMLCFGTVIGVGKKRYLFYNGNHYGKSGFGVAVLSV